MRTLTASIEIRIRMVSSPSPARILLIGALALAACGGHRPVTYVAPPTPPVYAEWQQRLAVQNTDAAIYQHASAECARLYEQGYELARMRLDAGLARPHTLPPAVIVDVDETVLDNSPYQVKNALLGRSFSPETWHDWVLMGAARPVPGALDFLRHAADRGCAVFYITNRSAEERNATVKNLFELRFPFADEEHVLCMEGGESDKSKRRARVAATHHVVLLVGDQLRDYDERFKDRSTNMGRDVAASLGDSLRERFVLLPNAMYGTWLDAVTGKVDSLKAGRKTLYLQENAY